MKINYSEKFSFKIINITQHCLIKNIIMSINNLELIKAIYKIWKKVNLKNLLLIKNKTIYLKIIKEIER